MIKYIKHSRIDKSKWDEAVNNSFNRLPYALSWYLDIVSPGWDALISDDYAEIMPLAHRSKYFIPYIFQPLLCQQLGVFSTLRSEPFGIDDFIKAIPQKFKLIDMTINSMNFVSEQQSGEVAAKTNQELNLNVGYDRIKKKYSKSHINNINHFEENPSLLISETLSFPDFYKIKMKSFKTKGVVLSRRDSKVYFSLLNELDKKGKLKIYAGVADEGDIPGGICYMYLDFDRVSIQTFCEDACKKSGFTFYFVDDFIKKNSGKNITFDFMGSSISGIRYFNLGFGSKDVTYYHLKINRIGNVLWAAKR
jgi:hypothetical protein